MARFVGHVATGRGAAAIEEATAARDPAVATVERIADGGDAHAATAVLAAPAGALAGSAVELVAREIGARALAARGALAFARGAARAAMEGVGERRRAPAGAANRQDLAARLIAPAAVVAVRRGVGTAPAAAHRLVPVARVRASAAVRDVDVRIHARVIAEEVRRVARGIGPRVGVAVRVRVGVAFRSRVGHVSARSERHEE